MRSKRKVTILTVGLLALFLFHLGCRKEAGAGPMAPDFTLPDLSGQMRTLSKYRGQVVVLDFWATWCLPCRMSIPELVKLKKKYGQKGLVILGISMDDPGQVTNQYLRAFKEKFQINYVILRYNLKVIRNYFGNRPQSIPTLFLIDREGKIRGKFEGFSPGVLERSLTGIL